MGYIKSVAFDTDGVLVDSDGLHFDAFNQVLKENNLKELNWDTYREQGFIAYDDKTFFEKYIEAYGGRRKSNLLMKLTKLIKQKEQKTQALLEAEDAVQFFPRVLAVIRYLARNKGIPLFEVTGSTMSETNRYFRNAQDVKECFQVVISADDNLPSKPDPAPYKEGLRRLSIKLKEQINPSQVVTVEDSPKGVQSAKSAGMFVIGIRNTAGVRELYAGGADIVIDFLCTELFDVLLHLQKRQEFSRPDVLEQMDNLACLSNEINIGTSNIPIYVQRQYWTFNDRLNISLSQSEVSTLHAVGKRN